LYCFCVLRHVDEAHHAQPFEYDDVFADINENSDHYDEDDVFTDTTSSSSKLIFYLCTVLLPYLHVLLPCLGSVLLPYLHVTLADAKSMPIQWPYDRVIN
jgi:hypothetical protein